MKKLDFLWLFILVIVMFVILSPWTAPFYESTNSHHPYLLGFLKFFILATMGELLSSRIIHTHWHKPSGLLYRALIWGFIGFVLVIIFPIYSGGIDLAFKSKLLPFAGTRLAFAFFTSTLLNFTFAPTMMAFHKITDAYIDKYYETKKLQPITKIVTQINWGEFVSFVIFKTIPYFWIPAHTITFLLPPEYRIATAAFLSIALGAILGYGKKPSKAK